LDLFSESHLSMVRLEQQRGQLDCFPNWIADFEADELFREFSEQLQWAQPELNVYGRSVRTPRLVAWYGDAGATYQYSGALHKPLPWHSRLLQLKQRLEQQFELTLNSVLANFYRNGEDSMGWHSDNEKELGTEPVICSISLGQPRYFDYRLIQQPKEKHRIELGHGSLLIMRGKFQQWWQHQIPKQKRLQNGRINLTYRLIKLNHAT